MSKQHDDNTDTLTIDTESSMTQRHLMESIHSEQIKLLTPWNALLLKKPNRE